MADLIERLNRCAESCEVYSPDQCATLIDGMGHLAMRHLLRQAAAALEAAREDAERLDWLDDNGGAVRAKDNARRNLIIWNAVYVPSCSTIRQAIDQARGKGGAE